MLCSQGISTGKYHAAILSNCEDCQKAIFDAGRTCGDLNFPLPYCPELHFREFDSPVADMKNSVMVNQTFTSPCFLFHLSLLSAESRQCPELMCRTLHRSSPGV